MKIKEVIQRVQSLYSKGVQSDDSRLTNRHIYNKLITVRAKLLRQRKNKKQKLSQWNYQILPCVELIEASKSECPCMPEIGCRILRTKHKLPKPISGLSGHLIDSVTSIDGSIVYDETTFKEKKFKKGNKYTKSKIDYYIRNEYLYLTHRDGPEVISITGLFEDPVEVENFPNICDKDPDCKDCNNCTSPLDKEFPLDMDLIDTTVELSLNELIQVFNANMEDTTNNTKDNIVEQTK